MNGNAMKRSRATLPALLIAAGLGALQVGSGCGRADSVRVGSEPPGGQGVPDDPVGATGSTSAAVLCDGSDDVRFLFVLPGSDGLSGYPSFATVRGEGFVAIDGQCRFWSANGATQRVLSGTLSADSAASFARAIGYEQFAEYPLYDDQQGCTGTGLTRIWSPAGRAHCICACQEDPDLEGWLQVINTMSDPGVKELFANGQSLTSPLQLALIGYPRILDVPVPWPLSRAPTQNEIYYSPDFDPPFLDESSGAKITDPGELSALRATRDNYVGGAPQDFTPLVWTDPETQQPAWFHMILRDELPAHVQAALERPSF